jgi:hypothetical protein
MGQAITVKSDRLAFGLGLVGGEGIGFAKAHPTRGLKKAETRRETPLPVSTRESEGGKEWKIDQFRYEALRFIDSIRYFCAQHYSIPRGDPAATVCLGRVSCPAKVYSFRLELIALGFRK